MEIRIIKAIAKKVSKKYSAPEPIVERVNRYKIEIRSELTLLEGGNELATLIEERYPQWLCEPYGGCIYYVYKPL